MLGIFLKKKKKGNYLNELIMGFLSLQSNIF